LGNEAFKLLGRNPKFYPQWEKDCGLKLKLPEQKFLYAAYAGNKKVIIVALNDSDKVVTKQVIINPTKLIISNVNGVDIFNKKKYKINNNQLTFTLLPRESAFVLFK
jgi:O-glycosyl hydrolase